MTCQDCQNQLVLYLEGLLDAVEVATVEEHLAACAVCSEEIRSLRGLRDRLLAVSNSPLTMGLGSKVMNQIAQEQAEQARRLKMRRRIQKFVASAAAALLLVSLTWAVLHFAPARAMADEVIARAAEAAANLKTIYLKCRVRTLPGDNFQSLDINQPMVDVELWKQYGPPLKWKIEKPGRVVVMNGQQTLMIMKSNEIGVKVDTPTQAAFDTGWLHQLASIDQMLAKELGSGASVAKQNADRENAVSSEVIVEVGPSKQVGEYLKNKTIDTAETRRLYTFNRDSGRLERAKFFVKDGGREVEILEIAEIKYDVPLEDSVFELEIPANIAWAQEPQRLEENEKYEKMTPTEVARLFFEACGKEDWSEAAKFSPMPFTAHHKEHLAGLEIIKLGEPFQAWPYAGWFVPYEIKFKDGRVQKHNLAVRNDNPAKRYVVDGGI